MYASPYLLSERLPDACGLSHEILPYRDVVALWYFQKGSIANLYGTLS